MSGAANILVVACTVLGACGFAFRGSLTNPLKQRTLQRCRRSGHRRFVSVFDNSAALLQHRDHVALAVHQL